MAKPIFDVVGVNVESAALLIEVDGGGPLATAFAVAFVKTMAERFLQEDSPEFKALQALDKRGGTPEQGAAVILGAMNEPGKDAVSAQLVPATDADKGDMGDALAALAKFTAPGKPH